MVSHLGSLSDWALWGLLATMIMAVVLEGSQGLGLSRMSLPFIAGTWVTGRRRLANVLGFVLYTLGGWLFAAVYAWIFQSIGSANLFEGLLLGIVHGLVLLIVILPLVAELHPRMFTEHDGPDARQAIEPPGFMGKNYGWRTPLVTLIAQGCYGAVLGYGFGPH